MVWVLLAPIHMEPSPRHPLPHPDDGRRDSGDHTYKPRILLAEDDHDFRTLLATVLRKDGYRVTEVAAGKDLLEAVDGISRGGDESPALIMSDERMPGLRGMQVLRLTREWHRTLPLVLMTAFGDDRLIAEAAEAGVTLVRKPFEVDDLRTLVRFLGGPGTATPQPTVCTACGSSDDPRWLDESREVVLCRVCRRSFAKTDAGERQPDPEEDASAAGQEPCPGAGEGSRKAGSGQR